MILWLSALDLTVSWINEMEVLLLWDGRFVSSRIFLIHTMIHTFVIFAKISAYYVSYTNYSRLKDHCCDFKYILCKIIFFLITRFTGLDSPTADVYLCLFLLTVFYHSKCWTVGALCLRYIMLTNLYKRCSAVTRLWKGWHYRLKKFFEVDEKKKDGKSSLRKCCSLWNVSEFMHEQRKHE